MCTDFLLAVPPKRNNILINGRSMEFGLNLRSGILVGGVGAAKTSSAPDGKPGYSWTAKYGYVGLNAVGVGLPSMIVDGMNSVGLSIGALWLPLSTQYQTVTRDSLALNVADFANWVLGTCKTVKDVEAAVARVEVWGDANRNTGKLTAPVHFSLYDANGDGIVIEYLGGPPKITVNPVGVMTNEPPFAWHLSNIDNYANLSATDAPGITVNGTLYPSAGHGSGMLGLPGDSTPPSRFIRALLLKQFALQSMTPLSSVADVSSLALHVLNTVDIPKGSSVPQDIEERDDYTQWAVIKVLSPTGGTFSYRTYENPAVCQIDLGASGLFSQPNEQPFTLPSPAAYTDVTTQVMPK